MTGFFEQRRAEYERELVRLRSTLHRIRTGDLKPASGIAQDDAERNLLDQIEAREHMIERYRGRDDA